jgi:hypothetical protein
MDFKGFGACMHAFRLFERFSEEIPGALSMSEWN